jgi:hypothetical protein
LPSVTGFGDKSDHAKATGNRSTAANRPPMTLGANCDLNPVGGFQNSQSVATC